MSAESIGEAAAAVTNDLARRTGRVRQFPDQMEEQMNQVAKVEPQEQLPAPVSETAAVLSMIERAARDPQIDINKLQQLMEMRDRMEAKTAERAFDAAMTEAQKEMRRVAADADNSQTRSKYATFAALDRSLRPIYTKHGFSLGFDTAEGAPEGSIRIVCKVAHDGGHRAYPHIDMPADGKGAKGGDVMTKTHATGSAVTYGRRYLLSMIFNIAVGDDDDGNKAGRGDVISDEQLIKLRDALEAVSPTDKKADVEATIRNFCKFMKASTLADIPAARFDEAMAVLAQKRQQATAKA